MGSTGHRRKTTEACNPCRARKLKCNGMLPCESCERNKVQCSYDPSTSASRLTGGLDIINARVMELERAVFGERTYQPRRTVESADAPQSTNDTVSGVTFVDEKTGVANHFGTMSTIDLLKSFHETVQGVLDYAPTSGTDERASKRRRREANEHPINSDASRSFRIQDIYASPTVRRATSWWPSGNLVEVHLDYFFGIIYSTIPIFDEKVFRATFRRFENTPESPQSQQWECLTYSVLALGALYSPNDTECAARYFAEAQGLLGSLLGVSSLKSVQAALLMAVYAHYTVQHNLAYDYLGIAIRLAYSAGLNSNFDEAGFTNLAVQEARRTWWTLYSLESELCVEYGRPLCIRETDSIASYPQEALDGTTNVSRASFIIVMAKFSRTVRKIIDLVSNIDEKRNGIKSFVGRLMNLQAELMTWRGELPAHLTPKDTATSEGLRARQKIEWVRRQCCDIELRFNHVMIVMHRPFFAGTNFSTPFYTSSMARNVCLGAAQDTILSLHKALEEGSHVVEWPCYYHRVVAATLIILTVACDSPSEEKAGLLETCSKSIVLFETMQFGCPEKGRVLVQNALALLSPSPIIRQKDAAISVE